MRDDSFNLDVRSTIVLAALLALPGCITPGSQNWFAGRPPVQGDHTVQRIPVPRNPAPPIVRQGPSTNGKKVESNKKDSADQNGGITLTVEAPPKVQRGSLVTFDVKIKNGSSDVVENLSLNSKFDAGLEYPGSDLREFKHKIDRLPSGESKLFSLTLQCKTDGQQCARFSLLKDQQEVVWKSVCVSVVEPIYGVSLILPDKRTAGSRVEPTIVVSNHSKQTLQNVRLELRYDSQQLKPYTLGERVKVEKGKATWNIGKLKPGEGVPLQGEFDCIGSVDQICLSTLVLIDDGPSDSRYRCFKVVSPPKTFDMRISETRDLLQIGDETEFIAGMKNRTDDKATGPSLVVDVPANFRIIDAEAWAGAFKLPIKPKIEDGRITFPSAGVIAAKSEVTVRVRVKALSAAQSAFRAEMLDGKTSLLKLNEPVLVLPK